jgi:hypothetical protein
MDYWVLKCHVIQHLLNNTGMHTSPTACTLRELIPYRGQPLRSGTYAVGVVHVQPNEPPQSFSGFFGIVQIEQKLNPQQIVKALVT